jgi:hypothetical protein
MVRCKTTQSQHVDEISAKGQLEIGLGRRGSALVIVIRSCSPTSTNRSRSPLSPAALASRRASGVERVRLDHWFLAVDSQPVVREDPHIADPQTVAVRAVGTDRAVWLRHHIAAVLREDHMVAGGADHSALD